VVIDDFQIQKLKLSWDGGESGSKKFEGRYSGGLAVVWSHVASFVLTHFDGMWFRSLWRSINI
jgi:hypothetical protein